MKKDILNCVPVILTGDSRNKFLHREEDKRLIIQGTHILFTLDEVERDIYYQIDNKKTVGQIVDEICQIYPGARKEIQNDIISFLQQLSNSGLIKLKYEK